jgi:hypothetical protein
MALLVYLPLLVHLNSENKNKTSVSPVAIRCKVQEEPTL